MTKIYDAIIIGTGQAGPPLAGRLSDAGMKVAILERDLFGGTCVNTGCTPTKTLIASARAAHVARTAGRLGIMVNGGVSVDMKKVKARKDEVAGASEKGIEDWLAGMENVTVYRGHGRFESPRTVSVNGELLEADMIFINTGGRAFVPPDGEEDGTPCFTNSSIMHVDFLPRHLIVIGGSYVGLEFAQMYRRFGSEVTVIEKGARLAGREDEDVSEVLRTIMEKEGINVVTGANCIYARKHPEGAEVVTECETGEETVSGSHVLWAVGRVPNTDDLGLDKAGVATDERGYIKVDDHLRTNVPGIWALGDCNGKGAFTHTSYNDFEIAAANLLDGDDRKVSDRITAYALYTDPPPGPGWNDGEGGQAVGEEGARREERNDSRQPRSRARRDGRVYKGSRRRRQRGNTRGGHTRDRGRRGHTLDTRCNVREKALYGDTARRSHTPDGIGADTDRIRRNEAFRLRARRGG
jgi:pyruvate/2-oxoglutarate dehydrogenase complex dihydrolipoamide dehydrogenase (E3) component